MLASMVELPEEGVGIGADLGGLRRWWWIPLLCTALAGLIANRASAASDPVFRSSARLVIAPIQLGTTAEVVDVAGVLDGATLSTTLAEVLTSGKIRSLASSDPTLEGIDLTTLSIDATALPDANVVELTVKGPSAGATERAAAVIGQVGAQHFQDLYTIYRVDQLDVGFVQAAQVAPSPTRDGAIGAFAGATLGIAVALILPNRRRAAPPLASTPDEPSVRFDPFDERGVPATVGNGRGRTSGSTLLR